MFLFWPASYDGNFPAHTTNSVAGGEILDLATHRNELIKHEVTYPPNGRDMSRCGSHAKAASSRCG